MSFVIIRMQYILQDGYRHTIFQTKHDISFIKAVHKHHKQVYFLIFFSVLRPFQDYFSSYESRGGRKQENPEKN